MSTTTIPLPTLAAQISPTGISAPAIENIVASDVAIYQGIYGSDVLLTPDTQDFQLIAARCTAINDTNQLAIAVYNSFAPGSAQGTGLSAAVQINGLTRESATNSTVALTISGVVGTIIQDGIASDANGNLWNLPALVTIPESGAITVTATAQQAGNISAPLNTVTTTFTIIPGWQSVTNPAAAVPGTAVETDAALRARQAQSTALSSQTPFDAILAAVANSGGIGRFTGFNNTGSGPDANGIPGHSIAIVVEGGNSTSIANAIASKIPPGPGTFGTTSVEVVDSKGVPGTINYFEVTEVSIFAAMTIQPLTGYVATTGQAAINALVQFINGLEIGEEIFYNWLLGVAGLSGNALGQTFVITSLTIGISPSGLANANIPIAFNAAATCMAANVILTTL